MVVVNSIVENFYILLYITIANQLIRECILLTQIFYISIQLILNALPLDVPKIRSKSAPLKCAIQTGE
jgi:hypothetical protein